MLFVIIIIMDLLSKPFLRNASLNCEELQIFVPVIHNHNISNFYCYLEQSIML